MRSCVLEVMRQDIRSHERNCPRSSEIPCPRSHEITHPINPRVLPNAGAKHPGRFTLPEPNGTCYLASSAEGALRESVGPSLLKRGLLVLARLQGLSVYPLRLPEDRQVAHVTSKRANAFGEGGGRTWPVGDRASAVSVARRMQGVRIVDIPDQHELTFGSMPD